MVNYLFVVGDLLPTFEKSDFGTGALEWERYKINRLQ